MCFVDSPTLDAFAASKAHNASGRLLRTLLSTSQTGVAPLYILLNAAVAGVLVWMPYTLLVEFSMLLSVPSSALLPRPPAPPPNPSARPLCLLTPNPPRRP